MFHLFEGTAQTQRLPGASQFPWKEILLVAIIVIALAVIGYGAKWFVSRAGENTSAPITAPVVPAVQQPVAQPVQQPVIPAIQPAVQPVQPAVLPAAARPVAQPVQPAPVVIAPIVPEVVDYRVTWTEVKRFNPFTIPMEEGFYNGELTQPRSVTLGPNGPDPVLESDAFVWKVLPHLKGIWGNYVAATRDQTDKNVVFVSILPAARYQPYILLSVNGEKSWCMLNLLPLWVGGYQQGDMHYPRVVALGEEIHLYGLDARPGIHWWETVVKKNALPCS